jgi:transcriptional regulator with PAS, ATPase and Fis domain
MSASAVSIDSVRTRIIHSAASPLVQVLDQLAKVAASPVNVLVTGESGTGKELVVRAVHDLSPWARGPFSPINCGAIPSALLESELFGHVRGAFTGADRDRPGRLEQASGGTLFLDEIGEMPLSLQVKLLRVLQEREFEPLGSSARRKAEFRLVAATNRDLEDCVVEGTFRQDLFFRLDVIRLHLPALRDRPMDIAPLARHFLRQFAALTGSAVEDFSAAAIGVLERHHWPGNIRELENVVQSLVVLKGSGMLHAEDVSARIGGRILPAERGTSGLSVELPEDGLNLKDALDRLEQHLVRQALKRTGGNKAKAAALLGINRTTLVEKLKRRPIEDMQTG